MKNQIHQQLVQLATAILQDHTLSATEIKDKAQQLYEQAVVLAYAEKNENSANAVETESLLDTENQTAVPISQVEENVTVPTSEITTKQDQVLDSIETSEVQIDEVSSVKDEAIPEAPALLHELENLTQGFDLPDFEPMNNEVESNETVVETPYVEAPEDKDQKQVSLNDTLTKGFNVGLNDRLAFTNQLFGGSQEDYTRVISQLNTTQTLAEAQQFINDIIKPEYNHWEGKETFELRFLELIERNFQS